MNDLVKIHSYYIYSLAAFTKVCFYARDTYVDLSMGMTPMEMIVHRDYLVVVESVMSLSVGHACVQGHVLSRFLAAIASAVVTTVYIVKL